MTRKIFLVLILIMSLAGCRLTIDHGTNIDGTGFVTTQYRSPGDFTQIHMNAAGNVQVAYGAFDGLTVEADNNLQSYIVTTVSNGVLVIGVRDGYTIHPTETVRFTVTVSHLTGFNLNGSGNVTISDVNSARFAVALNGSGNIAATGSCDNLDIDINGAGNVNTSDLAANYAYASISGSGDITLWALDYLNASISGYGDINYYGNPALVKSVTGYGTVRWMGY